MPWEKAFDIDNALEAAMNVFWAKGYEDTSLSDLLDAMKINKGSLYNAYGSKKKLFRAALEKYDTENSRAFIQDLKQIDDPVKAITTLFNAITENDTKDPESRGCFLVNTSLKLSYHDDDVRSIVINGLKEVELFLEACLKKIKKQNKHTAITDTKKTAKMLMTLSVGLRVLSRGTFNADSLNAVKRQALQLIS